jgi:hypothetical protein
MFRCIRRTHTSCVCVVGGRWLRVCVRLAKTREVRNLCGYQLSHSSLALASLVQIRFRLQFLVLEVLVNLLEQR